jgi:hypothetical protein
MLGLLGLPEGALNAVADPGLPEAPGAGGRCCGLLPKALGLDGDAEDGLPGAGRGDVLGRPAPRTAAVDEKGLLGDFEPDPSESNSSSKSSSSSSKSSSS